MSGNFISSVPLELITNNTIRNKIFHPVIDRHLTSISEFAMCFQSSAFDNRLIDVAVKKKYFNIEFSQVAKVAA